MSGDVHVRFREHPRGRFPRVTRRNVYVRSERAGQRVMAGLTAFLHKKLRLKVNDSKSAVARPEERKFLGFSFRTGKRVYRVIAPKPLDKFKAKVRALTGRTRGVTLKRMADELRRFLQGWKGYFGFSEYPGTLRALDEWVRRRIRCFIWKQWKRGSRRFMELTKRGIKPGLAARTAGSAHGPWRVSVSPALHIAFPKRFFQQLGIPSLVPKVD